MEASILLPDVCDTRWYEEKWAKKFVIVKTAFFWNVCFCRPLRSRRNDLVICTIYVKKPRGPQQNFLWHLSCWIKRKKGPKSFHHWKGCLFSKFLCFQQSLRSWRNAFIKIFSDCQNSLWTLIKLSLRFVTLGKTRKNGPKTLLTSWKPLFLKRLFLSTSYSPKKWSYP